MYFATKFKHSSYCYLQIFDSTFIVTQIFLTLYILQLLKSELGSYIKEQNIFFNSFGVTTKFMNGYFLLGKKIKICGSNYSTVMNTQIFEAVNQSFCAFFSVFTCGTTGLIMSFSNLLKHQDIISTHHLHHRPTPRKYKTITIVQYQTEYFNHFLGAHST